MTCHPDSRVLRELLRGELPPQDGRRLLEHALCCPECRQAIRRAWFETRPPESAPDDYEAPFEHALQGALGQRNRPGEPREEAALAATEALLGKLGELPHRDVRQMIRLAIQAWKQAQRVTAGRRGRGFVLDLKARVLCELGNAYRIADRFGTAAVVLRRAAALADHGSGDLLLATRISDVAASLHADQRHFAAAVAILQRVCRTYLKLGERHLAGRALISQALFTGFDGDPEGAILLLDQGIALIEPEREPILRLKAIHNQVLFLIDAERYREARILLWQNRLLYQCFDEPLVAIRRQWLEGRIYTGLRELAKAETTLRQVQAGLLRHGQVYDAALAALDLIRLGVLAGRREELPERVDDVLAVFQEHQISRLAVGYLRVFRERCVDRSLSPASLCAMLKLVASVVDDLDENRRRHRRHYA